MKRPFDGEFFASVYWQIFLRLTIFCFLALCVIDAGQGIWDLGMAYFPTRRCLYDMVNIVICGTFFGLTLWERTKYEDNVHNICFLVFFIVNVIFYFV